MKYSIRDILGTETKEKDGYVEIHREQTEAANSQSADSAGDGCLNEPAVNGTSNGQSVGPVHNHESPADNEISVSDVRDRVVRELVREGVVPVGYVRALQKRWHQDGEKEPLWRVTARDSKVDRDAVFRTAARIYGFQEVGIGEGRPERAFVKTTVQSFEPEKQDDILRLNILPYCYEPEPHLGLMKLILVTHDPTRPETMRLVHGLNLERFEIRYAPEEAISATLAEIFPRKNKFLERLNGDQQAYDLGIAYEKKKSSLIDEDALEAEIQQSSLINLVEAALLEAVRMGASDIHIYPNSKRKVEFHFRIDGELQLWHVEDKSHPEAILAVVKDKAGNIDRFERDAAQDGFIQRQIDDTLIRYRVSVLPIAGASQDIRYESIVIRVLDDRKVMTDLGQIGLLPGAVARFEKAIRQPHGMVIMTGPTGSGKSTTLVAALSQVVTPKVNVLTIEDPVEYVIPNVRQIKLNHRLGLEQALRAVLRHDPDIVMVGEMRDRPTAELAIKLANTGHLTFSTLHTNDAPSAISRLYKMGIEPFLIAYAINLVVAQRLVRTICQKCRIADDDPDEVLLCELGFTDEEIQSTTFYRANYESKCRQCRGTGYKGRRAISEALYFSRDIRHMIVGARESIDEDAIRELAVREGMLTLAASAREVIKRGESTVEELIRVTATE